MFPVCIISQDWKRDLWWRNILVGDDENGYCSHFALTLGSSILPPTFFGSCPPNFNTLFFPFNFPLFYLFLLIYFLRVDPGLGVRVLKPIKKSQFPIFDSFIFCRERTTSYPPPRRNVCVKKQLTFPSILLFFLPLVINAAFGVEENRPIHA